MSTNFGSTWATTWETHPNTYQIDPSLKSFVIWLLITLRSFALASLEEPYLWHIFSNVWHTKYVMYEDDNREVDDKEEEEDTNYPVGIKNAMMEMMLILTMMMLIVPDPPTPSFRLLRHFSCLSTQSITRKLFSKSITSNISKSQYWFHICLLHAAALLTQSITHKKNFQVNHLQQYWFHICHSFRYRTNQDNNGLENDQFCRS